MYQCAHCIHNKVFESEGERKGARVGHMQTCNDCDDTATHCNTLQHTLSALKSLFVKHTIDKETRYSYVPPGILMCVVLCCGVL